MLTLTHPLAIRRELHPAKSGQRVSPSVLQDGKKARTINDIYGPLLSTRQRLHPLSLWENWLRERLGAIGSTESPLNSKELATPAGRSISRRGPSTHPAHSTTPLPDRHNRLPTGAHPSPQEAAPANRNGFEGKLPDQGDNQPVASGSSPGCDAERRTGTEGDLRRAEPGLRLMVDFPDVGRFAPGFVKVRGPASFLDILRQSYPSE
jgi:hypothetical protein